MCPGKTTVAAVDKPTFANNVAIDGDYAFPKARAQHGFIWGGKYEKSWKCGYVSVTTAIRTVPHCFSWTLMPFSFLHMAYLQSVVHGELQGASKLAMVRPNIAELAIVWCYSNDLIFLFNAVLLH